MINLSITRPVKGDFIITQDFFGRTGWYKQHKALDIRTRDSDHPDGLDRDIVAVFRGETVKWGKDMWGDYYFILRHSSGLEAKYKHLIRLNHKPGWTIRGKGDTIGYSGGLPSFKKIRDKILRKPSTGPHCHLEFRKNGILVDPEPYFYNYYE